MHTATAYIVYLVISVTVTVWLARTLFHHGRLFLLDMFDGDSRVADAVNHLLLVAFVLLNVAFVALALRPAQGVDNAGRAIEFVSTRLGVVLVVLGVMHFNNMAVVAWVRRRARRVAQDEHRRAGLVEQAEARLAELQRLGVASESESM
jgi:uncharacterized membrane protein